MIFKNLNSEKAAKTLSSVLQFANNLSIVDNNPNRELIIIDNIYKFFNVIYFQNTKNRKFNAQVTFDTENGQETINIIDRSEIMIHKLYNKLKENITVLGINNLITISNYFLDIKGVDLIHKTNVIDSENNILKEIIENFIDIGNEKLVYDFIHQRLEIVINSISSYDDLIKGDSHFNQEPKALYNIFGLYLGYKVNYHIYRNQIIQVIGYLKEELDLNDDDSIKKILIKKMVNINSRFQIEQKSVYLELLEEEAGLFNKEELEFLKMEIEANPKGMTIFSMKFAQGSITKEIVEKNTIYTIIRFSLPLSSKNKKNGQIRIGDKYLLEYKEIDNKFADPVFRLYKDLSIGGMGWNFFSDTFYSEKNKLCTFAFVIPEFYHPDFEFGENGMIDIDFSNKKALTGRDYYPHKELIIEQLLECTETISNEIVIEKKDININIFSNYIVDYVQAGTSSVLYRKLYTITNPNSYTKASDKFIERLTELNLNDSFLPLSELMQQSNIVSDKALSNFLRSLINIVLKNNIELHSNYKYFWKKDKDSIKPQSEPEMQPLIMGQLRAICDYMGIQISREVESANGEIDFLCSFTYNNHVLKTCIELKNAHSPKYELGLTKQLPAYLKSERTKYGIYLILWYKGDDFSKPTSFDSKEALQTYLEQKRPKGFKVEVIIIDCSKPVVPSKMK